MLPFTPGTIFWISSSVYFLEMGVFLKTKLPLTLRSEGNDWMGVSLKYKLPPTSRPSGSDLRFLQLFKAKLPLTLRPGGSDCIVHFVDHCINNKECYYLRPIYSLILHNI